MVEGQPTKLYIAGLHVHTRHSGPAKHLRSLRLGILAAPFLIAPWVVAVRHSRMEREGIHLFKNFFSYG